MEEHHKLTFLINVGAKKPSTYFTHAHKQALQIHTIMTQRPIAPSAIYPNMGVGGIFIPVEKNLASKMLFVQSQHSLVTTRKHVFTNNHKARTKLVLAGELAT